MDAAAAGEGNLELVVQDGAGEHLPTRVEPEGGALFRVSFTPRAPATHTLAVTFNEEPVPGNCSNTVT